MRDICFVYILSVIQYQNQKPKQQQQNEPIQFKWITLRIDKNYIIDQK